MEKQTAVEWLEKEISNQLGTNDLLDGLYKQAKQMEHNKREELIKIIYNIGYTDAQCNHINDVDNLAHEIDYMQSQIDNTPKNK